MLFFESQRGQHWFTCPPISKNGPAPKIRLTTSWKPLAIDEATSEKLFAMLQLVV